MNTENGIDGATGEYLFPGMSDRQLANQARATLTRSDTQSHFHDLQHRADLRESSRGVVAWVDATDLATAGWGVIFAQAYNTSYSLEALTSDDGLGQLLKHRQAQATKNKTNYYRQCLYEAGQDKHTFLKAHKIPTSGAVDPDRGMPYYLLIVGDPVTIPYEFQYQLDVQYAVGRIYFDQLEDYAHYAQSVIRAETEPVRDVPKLQFWGASNTGDAATQLSAKQLIQPLADWVTQAHPNWATELLIKETATKAGLDRLINQRPAPAILFTASHGVGYPPGHPHQRDYQGALVCQDWGKFDGAPDPSKHLFAAADLHPEADIHGMIAFHFACYGLGTPQENTFTHRDEESIGRVLAEQPLISKLPQSLLSHPKGGALAVIGHVDRAFSDSFKADGQRQLSIFQSILTCLMKHCPVGYALEFLNQHYAELSSDCNLGIQRQDKSDRELADLWTASHNARNYAIFGDPAVRAAVAAGTLTPEDQPLLLWSQPSGTAVPAGKINPALLSFLQETTQGEPTAIERHPGNFLRPNREEAPALADMVSRLVQRVDELERRLEELERLAGPPQ